MRYFLFILLVGLLSACSSDDESNAGATAAKLEVSKNEVKLSNVDGSFTINVTATSTWTAEVTSTGDWLTISKSSGEGNGDLRLFFTENTDGPKRTGTVKVSMSGAGSTLEQEISVEQLGADPDILFDYSSFYAFIVNRFICSTPLFLFHHYSALVLIVNDMLNQVVKINFDVRIASVRIN